MELVGLLCRPSLRRTMVADPERPPPEPVPNDAHLPQASAASAPPPAEPLAQRLVMLEETKNTATKLSIDKRGRQIDFGRARGLQKDQVGHTNVFHRSFTGFGFPRY
jgi:hypothetical protein